MRLHPTQTHHLAICGRDLVILDEGPGTYSLIAGAGERAVQARDGALTTADPNLQALLLHNGVAASAPQRIDAGRPAPPTASALDAPHRGRARAWVWATVEAPLVYRGRAFATLLEVARRVRRRALDPNLCDPVLLGRAAGFDAATPLIPWRGACLFRSFMLLHQLHRAGYAPWWVFGVRTWPFAAHCWLQAGEVVLTDYADTLAPYTPILAV